ncbi:MAG: hypothetical protein WBL35_16780 [Ornithinibacter sp.]
MLDSVRPRDIDGKTRRRIAAEELAGLIPVEARMKKANTEHKVSFVAIHEWAMSLSAVTHVLRSPVTTPL